MNFRKGRNERKRKKIEKRVGMKKERPEKMGQQKVGRK